MSTLAVLFASALGLSSVALPLRALDAGRGAGVIGLLVALSALVQIVTRSRLGVVMRRVSDSWLLGLAPVALAGTFVVVLASPSVAALAVGWVLLALARACFWTAGQTHSVRGRRSSLRGLATLNFFGSLGALVGPLLAGVLAESGIETALVTGIALSAAGVIPALVLERFPPFARSQGHGKGAMWRRPGVDAACWSGTTAGAWRGLMDGYVPVVLEAARHSSTMIGALVSVANATSVVGTVIIGKLRSGWTAPTYVVSVLAAGIGLSVLGYVSGSVPIAALALGLSGLGAGVIQTLGPNLAATSVGEQEKGDAIAAYGTVRTSAMFLAPLAVAGGIVVLPLSLALLIVGAGLALPSFAVRSLKRMPTAEPVAP
ncbi:MFS transporter [Modestobacter sp. VKM Ac-2979]|uniref:MFS transporter n=1 Tax=unclassified Modestobacter TaxID=2643866 RepID=UPI0022AB7799|nr:MULTISPECIES: MFS transporter [unclassified Modestobacter]MCZ2813924.1 MFS transporter [Modestobacter sp. VKM Ac-2979]MCZ2844661.1 MFS transporter [Modestobacter sp. VKM Ac-2980]